MDVAKEEDWRRYGWTVWGGVNIEMTADKGEWKNKICCIDSKRRWEKSYEKEGECSFIYSTCFNFYLIMYFKFKWKWHQQKIIYVVRYMHIHHFYSTFKIKIH